MKEISGKHTNKKTYQAHTLNEHTAKDIEPTTTIRRQIKHSTSKRFPSIGYDNRTESGTDSDTA